MAKPIPFWKSELFPNTYRPMLRIELPDILRLPGHAYWNLSICITLIFLKYSLSRNGNNALKTRWMDDHENNPRILSLAWDRGLRTFERPDRIGSIIMANVWQ